MAVPVALALKGAISIVQLVSMGSQLVKLYQEGKLSEEELTERFNANALELVQLEENWTARQEAKRAGTIQKV